jgi:hypothetical protein
MPKTKSDRPSPTLDPTPEYAAARKASRTSSNVSFEEVKEQILRHGPKQNELVSYDAVIEGGVSILKRSAKPLDQG